MAKWQRIRVEIPKDLRPVERVAVANEIIEFIINRTQSGKDKDNNDFPGYTKGYKKSLNFKNAGKGSTPNLRLTGEMLNTMELISHKSGSLLIGYDRNDSDLNGKVEGNRIGSYGQDDPDPDKARDFLGITESDLNKILEKFPTDTKKKKDATRKKAIDIVSALRGAKDEL